MRDFNRAQRETFSRSVVRPPAAGERWPYRRELTRLLALAAVTRRHRCLEVGSGGGYLTRALLRRGARVTAVDFSRNQIRQLRRATPRRHARRLRTVLSSLSRLPRKRIGLYDRVFAVNLLHHLSDPLAGVRQLARFLRPGGTMVLMEPNGRSPLWILIRGLVWIMPGLTPFNWRDDRNLLLVNRETMGRALAGAGLRDTRVEPGELVPKIVLARLPPSLAGFVRGLERTIYSALGSDWSLNLVAKGTR